MATAVPHLHAYYVGMIDRVHASDPTLKCIFPSSAFSAVAYHFGPRTICFRHRDFANLPFGWCAVTALGSYDYEKGGHIIFWDLKCVIEFPPGSTILFPSAILEHSNARVSGSERRYSFTQFTAGALFRWADGQCQTRAEYLAKLSPEESKNESLKNAARWSYGLSLLPIVE